MESYTYIYNYIPTTSMATATEVEERNEVLDFMDGYCSSSLREKIMTKVIEAAGDDVKECVIAFIPSWSMERTIQRFVLLARYLVETTQIETYLDALTLKQDGDPVLKTKDLLCNPNRVKGRNVILIGSIYMTGHTLSRSRKELICGGAKSVKGVFVAKVFDSNNTPG